MDDCRVHSLDVLSTPEEIRQLYPSTNGVRETVGHMRSAVSRALEGSDDRLIVICGPCSIHDVAAAREYAEALRALAERYRDTLIVLMRVYFEKPRTTVGWKGLINDPDLDGSFRIDHGLRTARQLLLEVNEMGLGTATEFLDTISPQYFSDLISWGAIGARTAESQLHRELASGMSMPIGFKNGTTGNVQLAVDAVRAARATHAFLGVTQSGKAAIVRTTGNGDAHVVLRGGSETGPQYEEKWVSHASQLLDSAQLPGALIVDCSHANSNKQFKQQLVVGAELCRQVAAGSSSVRGVMIESHLHEGNQSPWDKPLRYGVSVTDACLGMGDTRDLLCSLSRAVERRRARA